MLIHPSEVQVASLEPSGENEHERTRVGHTAGGGNVPKTITFLVLAYSQRSSLIAFISGNIVKELYPGPKLKFQTASVVK